MKKFSVPCDFGGTVSDFVIYVGQPKEDSHPLHFQSTWLSKERGGAIPPAVMDSLEKLHNLSKENAVSFEELCVFAIGAANGADGKQPATDKALPPSDGGGNANISDQSQATDVDVAADSNNTPKENAAASSGTEALCEDQSKSGKTRKKKKNRHKDNGRHKHKKHN